MFLVWESPKGRVARELGRSVLIVGRDPVADLRIDDPSVSPRHALVQVEGSRVRITDLRSARGTRINGARLVADIPSTLEAGDFLHVGDVVLGLHRAPPPAAPRAAPPPPPRAAPARGARRPLGGAVVTVGLVAVVAAGALLAVLLPRDAPEVREAPPAAPAPPPAAAPAPPPLPPEPVPEPGPGPVPGGPERAPADALPPGRFADASSFPDLLELDGARYAPVALRGWDGTRVEAIGADGLLYAIARGRVTKIEDRKDLGRRAAHLRERLPPGDADARLDLARWCAARFLAPETKALAAEVLRARPGDAAALALLHAAEGG